MPPGLPDRQGTLACGLHTGHHAACTAVRVDCVASPTPRPATAPRPTSNDADQTPLVTGRDGWHISLVKDLSQERVRNIFRPVRALNPHGEEQPKAASRTMKARGGCGSHPSRRAQERPPQDEGKERGLDKKGLEPRLRGDDRRREPGLHPPISGLSEIGYLMRKSAKADLR